METLLAAARPLIELAIAEDIGPGDATSQSILDADLELRGRLVAKAPGVIAGLPVAEAVFRQVDTRIAFVAHVADGQEVVPGELVAEVTGPGPSLLAAEGYATGAAVSAYVLRAGTGLGAVLAGHRQPRMNPGGTHDSDRG